eukprot:scaffold49634_cov33-Phaeocystis_antarctica.AAC.1
MRGLPTSICVCRGARFCENPARQLSPLSHCRLDLVKEARVRHRTDARSGDHPSVDDASPLLCWLHVPRR